MKKFFFIITGSMMAMFIGAIMIAYIVITEQKTECAPNNSAIHIKGKILDISIDKYIVIKYRLGNKYVVESFDKCSKNNISKYIAEDDQNTQNN